MEFFVKVTEDEGIYKRVLKEGYGQKPQKNTSCIFNYKGALENEVIFDEGKNFQIRLDNSEVISGWEYALKSMKKGEISIFVIRYDYGYGKNGFSEIPPFSNLIYYIELTDFI